MKNQNKKQIIVVAGNLAIEKYSELLKEKDIKVLPASATIGKSGLIEHLAHKINREYKDIVAKLDETRKNPCPPSHIKTRNKRR